MRENSRDKAAFMLCPYLAKSVYLQSVCYNDGVPGNANRNVGAVAHRQFVDSGSIDNRYFPA
ncbi:unknown [Acidiphilium sp. CAG:727]|nr:unknown [Acidiphilium sp. CAG:727]